MSARRPADASTTTTSHGSVQASASRVTAQRVSSSARSSLLMITIEITPATSSWPAVYAGRAIRVDQIPLFFNEPRPFVQRVAVPLQPACEVANEVGAVSVHPGVLIESYG